MNEVSIIINGVRYDAVEANNIFACSQCELDDICLDGLICLMFNTDEYDCFKKSTKSFER